MSIKLPSTSNLYLYCDNLMAPVPNKDKSSSV
nr:MAG TPA: hypothetical protein [Bacteriophage sp.]